MIPNLESILSYSLMSKRDKDWDLLPTDKKVEKLKERIEYLEHQLERITSCFLSIEREINSHKKIGG